MQRVKILRTSTVVALAVLGLVGCLAPCASAAPIIIDPFTIAGGEGTTSAAAVVTVGPNTAAVANAIGGFRTGLLQKTSGGAGAPATLSILTGTGQASFSLGGTAAGTFSLLYNANGAGLNADLSGFSSLVLPVNLDPAARAGGGTTIQVIFTDETNASATASQVFAGALEDQIGIFSAFPGVDFSQIKSIEIRAIIPEDGDVRLTGSIVVNPEQNEVPEPATMLLLGVGIAGVVGYRARRKKLA
jgi:hypothetical protein